MAWPAIAARLAAFVTKNPKVAEAVSSAIGSSRKKLQENNISPEQVQQIIEDPKKRGMRDISRTHELANISMQDQRMGPVASMFGYAAEPEKLIKRGELKGPEEGRADEITGRLLSRKGTDIQAGVSGLMAESKIPIVSQFGQFGEALAKALDKLKMWTDALHEANMQFAEFSGAMANVQAEQTQRDIQLGRERGERRSESARYLAEGKSQLDRSLSQAEDFGGRIQNYIGGFASRIGTLLNYPFEKLFELGNKILDTLEGKEEDKGEYALEEGFKDEWVKRYGRPPNFPS